ncbi:MAG: neutral/alkaline non-lysosomal ceramidase N-terminal domain-containing protein [Planctomycetia bacterium]|nr:neutral/alkaline non-lysosomal ceramidase N-terminal domain-containing protein [Planctomycetia bacterium]
MTKFINTLAVCFLLISSATFVHGATFKMGTASVDITPATQVALTGQSYLRVSQGVNSPLTANVLALESQLETEGDSVIFVSLDICAVTQVLTDAVREKVTAADSSIDTDKIILSATHAHTAPAFEGPALPKWEGLADYSDVVEFVSSRIAEAVVQAWQNRSPNAEFAWGVDYAGVGFSRREVYRDGTASLYGKTSRDDFDHFENVEDHEVGAIFFRNENKKLCAILVNVACPSQVNEGDKRIDADYWHYVREDLHKKFGDDVVILAQCSAAGDVSPHYQYHYLSQARSRTLRGFLEGKAGEMQEIARKITAAVSSAWEVAEQDWQADVPFQHEYKILKLPMRIVTEAEMKEAQAGLDRFQAELDAHPEKTASEVNYMFFEWYGSIVDRYNEQQANKNPTYKTPVHVLQLGDLAFCTNQFELFTDFGIWMKTHSPAVQTFVIQLAGAGATPSTYLATKRAVEGGGYSAVIGSNVVSPEGGDQLVRETIDTLRAIWK